MSTSDERIALTVNSHVQFTAETVSLLHTLPS